MIDGKVIVENQNGGKMNKNDLIKKGFCLTSNKFGIISRIDRPDWKNHMAILHTPWSLEEGLRWIDCLGEMDAEDFYRRCHTKDKIELGMNKGKTFPRSHTTITGYVE